MSWIKKFKFSIVVNLMFKRLLYYILNKCSHELTIPLQTYSRTNFVRIPHVINVKIQNNKLGKGFYRNLFTV